ncbi:MAG TPA: adenylate kinase [Candidatus Omnitrophota bacterium]|nr:adenylate kinase [Candidatus Omnitrophota bacterium]HPD83946.1 adenylate kinase [Candidatus Omnitrophota bacterium]HRZ02803.1 adenylate kinase [Candidatus Omnitrophota bacterium]
MRLVLLGPPGAGKGTQAGSLKEDLKVPHISTGDILREEMKAGTALGLDVKKYVESGKLVPDEVVTKIIETRLVAGDKANQGFMLDGFPRTKKQAEDLDAILTKANKPLDYAIYFDTSLPVIVQRLTGRRVCRQCNALYHTANKPPKKEGVCDTCAGPLYQRPDDNEETIKTRMDVYLKSTAPIIDYYQAQGKLKKVNADKDALDVKGHLMKIFHADGKINQDKVRRRN